MKTHNIYREILDTQDESTRAMTRFLLIAIGAWFALAFIGGMLDIFYQPGVPPLTVGLFLLAPIGGFTVAYTLSPQVRLAVDSIPLWLITIAHVWRFVGIGFVIGAIVNILPAQFGYPEGIGDVIAAALCLPLAFALRRHDHTPRLRTAYVAWNIFGLIDLVSAITLGVLYSPSSFGVLRTDVSTQLMTTFPVSLIPTFFLPLFILLHMLGLKRSGEVAGK